MASFLNRATRSLDIALYDLRLEDAPSDTLFGAFDAALKRGVVVRLLFNQDHAQAIPVPPPPEIDWAFIERLKAIGVQVTAGSGGPDPMDPKDLVRQARP